MAFKIASSLYTNQGGSSTVITDTGEARGNQSGKKGTTVVDSNPSDPTNYVVSLDLSSGNYFDFNPDYSAIDAKTYLIFDFGGSDGDYFSSNNRNVPKNFEFYLFWHNYKDTSSSSRNFNYFFVGPPRWVQIVKFKDSVDNLDNSNSGLLDGFTQVFKFTSIEPYNATDDCKPYYGSLYMRNCR